jgi:hypothetical protein
MVLNELTTENEVECLYYQTTKNLKQVCQKKHTEIIHLQKHKQTGYE